MSLRFRLPLRAWIAIPLCALGFLVWIDRTRMQWVDSTTAIAQESPKISRASATGYVGGVRQLIVPEHNNDSYSWIVQTQEMLTTGEGRIRRIDYENAPFGRNVSTPSPYRWWLGFTAELDHLVSGRTAALSVEKAALWADPLLHGLFLVASTAFVAWQFGALPAALLSLGLVTLFPFAAEYLPGAPGDQGLTLAGNFWSVLLLLVGLRARPTTKISPVPADSARLAERWFFLAGIVGGLSLWVSAIGEVPILVGICVGAVLTPILARWRPSQDSTEIDVTPPWLAWGLGGALSTLGAYLIEYYPDHLTGWNLRLIHPLYGLAWLGAGALLADLASAVQRKKITWTIRSTCLRLLSIVFLAALPVFMAKKHDAGFLTLELSSFVLSKSSTADVATNIWAWVLSVGITPHVWSTMVPALFLFPALGMCWMRRVSLATRSGLLLALAPALVAIAFASRELSWWNHVDAMLLVVLVVSTVALLEWRGPRVAAKIWSACAALIFFAGASQLIPPTLSKNALDESDLKGLIERDLAHWLQKHVGPEGALVLAPPRETLTLYYYGGIRGLGSFSWENKDGFAATVRIASATTPEEAQALVERRGVTHIVIPSWDSYLDEYVQLGSGQLEGSFLSRLHAWTLPPWLKPVAYQLPAIPGFEGQSVAVLEVVEEQDDATSLSRLAVYFVEMGKLDLATSVAAALRRFPADLGAWAARAEVATAIGDQEGVTAAFKVLLPRLKNGAASDRSLSWERRVGLAVVLARAQQIEVARAQVRRCVAEMDEAKLRTLSTGSLYHLLILCKAFDARIADPKLHDLALDLLPVDAQEHLSSPTK